MVSFEDWKKLDLRVGQIKEALDHPNADKLVILKVDVGDKEVQLVAGVKKNYSLDSLIGKKIIVFTNLEPTTLRGVKSEGMLLAAIDNDDVSLLTLDKDVKNGSRIE